MDIAKDIRDFLMTRRARITPEQVGLPPGRRRRVPGLRREEVAGLAGIGVDWYIRLEQGRSVTPSATTVDALADALRLTNEEHAHLRALTRNASHVGFVRERVPEALQRLVATLRQPAYVLGRRWDLLTWNRAADQIFSFRDVREDDLNILVLVLTHARTRRLFGSGWADEARRIVAQFRAVYDLWAKDPAFSSLRERLEAGCPELERWWTSHDVRRAASGTKTIRHPSKGTLRFAHASFQSNDDPALRLVMYTPL